LSLRRLGSGNRPTAKIAKANMRIRISGGQAARSAGISALAL